MNADPRRSIAQLAVAVMTADGRITPGEQEALHHLDRLGLGPLSAMAEEEILRAVHQPIDVRAACEGLAAAPRAAGVIVSALADVAVSDHEVTAKEIETLRLVATQLGLPVAEAVDIINAALCNAGRKPDAVPGIGGSSGSVAQPGAPERDGTPTPQHASVRVGDVDGELAQAYRVLGLEPGAPSPGVDRAYLGIVERYNPAKVLDLGADFVALAVRRLAEATTAFETIRMSDK